MEPNEQLGMQIRKGLNWVRQGPPKSSDDWALGRESSGSLPTPLVTIEWLYLR